MKLTILNVAFPFAPVREDTSGGAEQVLLMLDAAITAAGHVSLVAACSGSACRGRLFTTGIEPGQIDDRARRLVWERHRETIQAAIAACSPNLIHLHGIDFHRYMPEPGVPALVTLHLPTAWYPDEALDLRRTGTWFNCVSGSQHETCPARPLLPYIENGIDADFFLRGSRREKKNFALSLGRICPEKEFHIALAAARKAGTGCIIAGEVFPYPAHRRYFEEAIAPGLDDGQYRFIGKVGAEKKRELLSEAKCLLVPSLAPETSSLVAMEALACGTPVIAFPAGELASIIDHGVTGFLVRSEEEMAGAIARVDDIDPAACRAAAQARFDAKKMTGRYLRVYEQLIATASRRDGSDPVSLRETVGHEN